jgi:hypothetical protein
MDAYNKDNIKRRRNGRHYKGWNSSSQLYRPLNTEGNKRREKSLKVSMRQLSKQIIQDELNL